MSITSLDAKTVWLTTAEVHRATHISVQTLQIWARTGTSPVRCRKIGRLWVWHKDDLDRLLRD